MSAGQHEGGEEVFTLAEIQRALAEEGEGRIVQEVVMGALEKFVETRKQEEVDQHRLDIIKGICIGYRRTNSDNDSNIESWVSSIKHNSLDFLDILARDPERPLSEIDIAARDAAAAAYVYLESFYGSVDTEPLEKAGVDTEQLLEYFEEGRTEVWTSDSHIYPEIEDKMPDLRSIGKYIAEGGMPEWEVYMGRRILKVTEMLEAAGVQLPVLGGDGRYDEER